jgi:hypothetical protein
LRCSSSKVCQPPIWRLQVYDWQAVCCSPAYSTCACSIVFSGLTSAGYAAGYCPGL